MFIVAIVFLLLTLILAIPQAILVFVVPLGMRRKTEALDNDACPHAAVVLCVRGSDPFLSQCIEGLLTQDYADYELFIIVDHPDDLAWPLINEVIQNAPSKNVHVDFLKERLETCSLKCSSLVQALESLSDSHEVVAFLDADVIPHKSWLRELVTPLVQEDYVASMGYRWRVPQPATVGSLVRALWSAQNVVQQYWSRGIWGGCWAIKQETLRELDVVEHWSRAFVEDAFVTDELVKRKHRVAFVPELAMMSSETSQLGDVYRWIRRLLFTTRLYISGWIMIVLHALFVAFVLMGAAVVAIVALMQANWTAAAIAGSGLLVYLISNTAPLAMLDTQVRRIVDRRGEEIHRLGFVEQLKILVAFMITHAFYVTAVIACHFMSTVSWRRIDYEVNGPFQVRMCHYNAFVDDGKDQSENVQSVF